MDKLIQTFTDGFAGFVYFFRSKNDEDQDQDKEYFQRPNTENFHNHNLLTVPIRYSGWSVNLAVFVISSTLYPWICAGDDMVS
jgi:hypothetical protein